MLKKIVEKICEMGNLSLPKLLNCHWTKSCHNASMCIVVATVKKLKFCRKLLRKPLESYKSLTRATCHYPIFFIAEK